MKPDDEEENESNDENNLVKAWEKIKRYREMERAYVKKTYPVRTSYNYARVLVEERRAIAEGKAALKLTRTVSFNETFMTESINEYDSDSNTLDDEDADFPLNNDLEKNESMKTTNTNYSVQRKNENDHGSSASFHEHGQDDEFLQMEELLQILEKEGRLDQVDELLSQNIPIEGVIAQVKQNISATSNEPKKSSNSKLLQKPLNTVNNSSSASSLKSTEQFKSLNFGNQQQPSRQITVDKIKPAKMENLAKKPPIAPRVTGKSKTVLNSMPQSTISSDFSNGQSEAKQRQSKINIQHESSRESSNERPMQQDNKTLQITHLEQFHIPSTITNSVKNLTDADQLSASGTRISIRFHSPVQRRNSKENIDLKKRASSHDIASIRNNPPESRIEPKEPVERFNPIIPRVQECVPKNRILQTMQRLKREKSESKESSGNEERVSHEAHKSRASTRASTSTNEDRKAKPLPLQSTTTSSSSPNRDRDRDRDREIDAQIRRKIEEIKQLKKK